MMFKDNYHNRVSKFIATQKPNKVKVDAVAATAEANTRKLCECTSSEPGKIIADISAQKPRCHIRKRLQTGRYTVSTSVTLYKFNDGFALGVAVLN